MKLVLYVEPVAKARPRLGVAKSGKKYAYTDRRTAHTENLIRDKVMKLGQYFAASIPLRLEATFYRERPKSLPKGVRLPVSKPDWDNLGKLLTDALEKFIYANDSQITSACIQKRYGSPPRIELLITEDEL